MPAQSVLIELTGLEALRERLDRLDGQVDRAGLGALHEAHEAIMTEAKRRTPVLTGALRASGQVRPPHREGRTLVSEGGFGNASVSYALIVHERTDLRHRVGQAKFYESALLDAASGLAERLAQAIRAGLGL